MGGGGGNRLTEKSNALSEEIAMYVPPPAPTSLLKPEPDFCPPLVRRGTAEERKMLMKEYQDGAIDKRCAHLLSKTHQNYN